MFHIETQERLIKEEWRLLKPEVHFLTMEGTIGEVNVESITEMIRDVRGYSKIDTER